MPRNWLNLQHRPVRGRTRDVHSSSLLIDVYAFLTLVSDGGQFDPGREIPDLLLKSDVNLSNHLVRKVDAAGCCSAGSGYICQFSFSVADLYCLKLFLR